LPEKLEGKAGLDDLITLLVLFLGSPTHVKNPYLRAKLVELMHSLTPKVVGRNLGLFENNVVAQRHLARVLMSFYVDIEFAERKLFLFLFIFLTFSNNRVAQLL
jgi:ubiquitin conjugation factor E4 B